MYVLSFYIAKSQRSRDANLQFPRRWYFGTESDVSQRALCEWTTCWASERLNWMSFTKVDP